MIESSVREQRRFRTSNLRRFSFVLKAGDSVPIVKAQGDIRIASSRKKNPALKLTGIVCGALCGILALLVVIGIVFAPDYTKRITPAATTTAAAVPSPMSP